MDNGRQDRILQLLEQKGEIQLSKLKDLFPEVSVMTLRRDLISLENKGHAVRTYGGAVSTSRLAVLKDEEDAYTRRAAENVEAKLEIASKAISLVEHGRSIYLDAGSTIMCLARMLADETYSIVTSGVNIALELLKKNKISVVALGGQLNRNTLSMSGPNALALLDSINIDLAFMSASGFSNEHGFTVSNPYEGELKRKVVSKANKVIALVDSGKINKDQAFTYAHLRNIDVWVCESPLPKDIEIEAKKYNVQIL
ncbi:MAG: DeoR/GlpR family DNA-binding transcription regulator [Eubacteriales bacterium]|nr:DeoR/GlpR family DNA-binding transcription regulator [Eubacteriales bacterium]